MHYSKQLVSLIKEARQPATYKFSAKKFFFIYPLIPLLVEMFALILEFFVCDFIYNLMASPVNYLEAWQKQQFENKRHATEAVVAFVTTPLLLVMRFILSIFSIYFYLLWFFIMCITYLTTAGKIRWQPYMQNAKFDDENMLEQKPFKYSDNVHSGYIAITFAVSIISTTLFLICFIMSVVPLNYYTLYVYNLPYYIHIFFIIFMVFYSIQFVLITLVNAIVFRRVKSVATAEQAIKDSAALTAESTETTVSENTSVITASQKISQSSAKKESIVTKPIKKTSRADNEVNTWICKKCGEENPSSVITCRGCGEYK